MIDRDYIEGFISSDNSGDYYFVPRAVEEAWRMFNDGCFDDDREGELPEGCEYVGGFPDDAIVYMKRGER